jgi:hypothetical protein
MMAWREEDWRIYIPVQELRDATILIFALEQSIQAGLVLLLGLGRAGAFSLV